MLNRKEGKPSLPPLGLMYIAGTLQANGFEDVEILDVMAEGYYNETEFKQDYIRYGLSPEDIKKKIKDFNPDIVGVSCMVDLRKYQALEICELAKEVSSEIITVIGGNPVTCSPNYYVDKEYIDYAIVGEGEQPFLELAQGKEPLDIQGIAFKHSSGANVINPQIEWRKDLDNIPFPAHNLINFDMYLDIWKKEGYQTYEAKKFTMMIMARGCPNACRHCPHDVLFPGYRTRSAKNVFDEVKLVHERFGIEEVQFHEYNGIVSWVIMEQFCNLMIESGLAKKIRWGFPIGIWLKVLNRDKLKLMREAGMDYLCLAIESYDQSKLDEVMKGKDVDLSHLMNVIKWGREFKYGLHGFFMLGLEGQDKKDIENTIDFATELDIDGASFFIAQPLPGTPFWDWCVENDKFIKGFDKFHIRYGKANTKVTGITGEELEYYRHLGRKKFIESKGDDYQKIKEADWTC